MHKIVWVTSKYAQNNTRIFQKYTKSHEELPKRHKTTKNFQKCTKFNEELQKMHKIPPKTSKYAQNPTRFFRKCARYHH
jgi:hypothetical protein